MQKSPAFSPTASMLKNGKPIISLQEPLTFYDGGGGNLLPLSPSPRCRSNEPFSNKRRKKVKNRAVGFFVLNKEKRRKEKKGRRGVFCRESIRFIRPAFQNGRRRGSEQTLAAEK